MFYMYMSFSTYQKQKKSHNLLELKLFIEREIERAYNHGVVIENLIKLNQLTNW